jgi:hypothetical protein
MAERLTWLEGLLLDTLRSVSKYLDKRVLELSEYSELRGSIVKAIHRAENVRDGCSTGTHSTGLGCHCPKIIRKAA